MSHRHFQQSPVERLTICPGSNRRPLSHWLRVGICPQCGVRTFIHQGLIRPHETTRAEVAAHHRRGPRHVKGSR